MSEKIVPVLGSLVAAVFIKGLVYPNWSAALELIAALGFVAYIVWVNPSRKLEVKPEEVNDLRGRINSLEEQIKFLKLKLGFMKG